MSAIAGYFPDLPATLAPVGASAKVPVRIVRENPPFRQTPPPPRPGARGTVPQGEGRRTNPPAKIGDVFGCRRVVATLPRDATSNEKVEWVCLGNGAGPCGARGVSYVFNLRKNLPKCGHAPRASTSRLGLIAGGRP